jgi:hypothetical protein
VIGPSATEVASDGEQNASRNASRAKRLIGTPA